MGETAVDQRSREKYVCPTVRPSLVHDRAELNVMPRMDLCATKYCRRHQQEPYARETDRLDFVDQVRIIPETTFLRNSIVHDLRISVKLSRSLS